MIGMEVRSFARSGSMVVAEMLLDGLWKQAGGRHMIDENSQGFLPPIKALKRIGFVETL